MASKLRTPALVVALIATILIILVETGSSFRASMSLFDGLGDRATQLRDGFSDWKAGLAQRKFSGPEVSKPEVSKPEISKPELSKPELSLPKFEKAKAPSGLKQLESSLDADGEKPPGFAVAALIHLDIMLLVTLLLFNLPLIISARLIAKLQGCVSCLLGLASVILGLITILKALVSLILMVTLLMAIPFGTLVYLARYADFDTTKAAAILGTLMFLKVVLVIALVVAHERFLLNCGFIVLMATSFIAMIIVTFLHNFPPGFLVSITDGIAAIIVSILAIIWGIIFLIGGVIGIVNMIKGTIL